MILAAALCLLAGGVIAWKTHRPAEAAEEAALIKTPIAKAKKAAIPAEAKIEPNVDDGMLQGTVTGHRFATEHVERTPEELAIINKITQSKK